MSEFFTKDRPEDPARIARFRERIQRLDWSEQGVEASLTALFAAVDDLAMAELQYYYRRRQTRAVISGVTRTIAWCSGSVGVILPLLAGVPADTIKPLVPYGYAALAVAGSALAANALFGGSDGHVRFVSTQLKLEKLITSARVSWCRFQSEVRQSPEEIQRGFTLIQTFATELHELTLNETGSWGQGLLAELGKYEKSIKSGSDTFPKVKND